MLKKRKKKRKKEMAYFPCLLLSKCSMPDFQNTESLQSLVVYKNRRPQKINNKQTFIVNADSFIFRRNSFECRE